jgi:hypothetical protein
MADSRAWLEKYTHEAKEKNIELEKEQISS